MFILTHMHKNDKLHQEFWHGFKTIADTIFHVLT